MLDVLAVPAGEYLLQSAAGSVLGRQMIQLCLHRGIKTINLVRRAEQAEELKALGADEVIVTSEEDIGERVKEITGGKGAYAGVECVGGELFEQVTSGLRAGGTCIVYGAMSGLQVRTHRTFVLDITSTSCLPTALQSKWGHIQHAFVRRFQMLPPTSKQRSFHLARGVAHLERPSPCLLNHDCFNPRVPPALQASFCIIDLLFRGVQLRGFWLPVYVNGLSPEDRERVLGEVMDLLAQGVISPYSGTKFELGDVVEAVAAATAAARGGKVLLEG